MNTGRTLGLRLSSRKWGTLGFTTLLTFCLAGPVAVSADTNVRSSSIMKTSVKKQDSLRLSNRRLQLEGKMRLGTQMYTDSESDGTNASFGFGLKFDYEFIEWLKLRSETRLNFSRERFQAQVDDTEFSNGFSVKEAVAVVQPHRFFEFGAGAVNQYNFGRSWLLMDDNSFPGMYQKLQWKSSKAYVALELGQAIPTSRSFDSNRQEKEETPYYFTEGVRAGYRPNKHLQLEPYLTHYRFENLPSVVAFQSATRGNTVPDPQPTNSQFRYGFDGILTGIKTTLRPTKKLSVVGEFQHLQNNQAKETFNTGQLASLSLKSRYKRMVFEPKIATFFNESDTSPAIYNSPELGNNNREGMIYSFDVIFKKYNFKISTDYVVADVINPNEVQSDMKYLVVHVETLYVEF